MIKNVLEENIYLYSNLLKDPKGLIDSIEELDIEVPEGHAMTKWKDWSSSINSEKMFGKTKDFFFTGFMPSSEIDKKIYLVFKSLSEAIDIAMLDYMKSLNLTNLYMPQSISIKKYNENAYMGPHVDSGDITSRNHPKVSMVFYLNDNYEGGEIEFPNQGITIKPEAGSIIIFPSHEPYMHDPKTIISGIKYMCPLFWYDHPV